VVPTSENPKQFLFAHEILHNAVVKSLEAFSTTVEEDEAAIQQEDLTYPERLILQYRINAKTYLNLLIKTLSANMAKLKKGTIPHLGTDQSKGSPFGALRIVRIALDDPVKESASTTEKTTETQSTADTSISTPSKDEL